MNFTREIRGHKEIKYTILQYLHSYLNFSFSLLLVTDDKNKLRKEIHVTSRGHWTNIKTVALIYVTINWCVSAQNKMHKILTFAKKLGEVVNVGYSETTLS
jgi:hypothetical protein